MAESTKIQWCDHTLNPWRGCHEVHAGCDNCYARTLSKRNPKTLGVWGPQGTRVVAAEAQWKAVERWNREAECQCGAAGMGDHVECAFCASGGVRPRVFVASLADVFEDWKGPMADAQGRHLVHGTAGWLPEIDEQLESASRVTMADVRARLFRLIDRCPNLDFLLVTKRPKNVLRIWPMRADAKYIPEAGMMQDAGDHYRENVWLLTSVSDQQTADAMIPELLKCRDLVPVLGISAEPLLSDIDLSQWLRPTQLPDIDPGVRDLDWVIVGCESGPGRRPMRQEWARSLVDQCRDGHVACFVKQINVDGTVCGDIDRFPASVQVREYPEVPQ